MPRALVPFLLVAGALVGTGCISDLFQTPTAPAPAAPVAPGHVASLWELAPVDAVEGVVLHDGAVARALALMADPDRSTARADFEAVVRKRSGLPFNLLAPEDWAGAGLDPQKGAAAFTFADKKRGALLVLPVVDRALFRRALDLRTRLVDGREIDQLDDDTSCEPAAGRYLCARSLATLAAAAAPHVSPLAASALELDEHGDIELYVSRDAPRIARFDRGRDSPGWLTAVAGAIRLRDDGATLHVHASGSLATPFARGYYAALPPPDLLALAEGAPSVGRIHVDPMAVFPETADLEPDVRSELVEQLTGDVEVIPSGSGFAGATLLLPVHDAPRVEAFAKKRCAQEAAKKEHGALGGFTVTAHGCAAVFAASRLTLPVKLPEVPVVATVAEGRLVITIGDAGKATPGAPGAPRGGEGVDGAAAQRALVDAETLLFFGHNLGIGPEVGAGAFFRAAVPLFGDRVAEAAEAWSYASAHLSQALVHARVTDEEVDFTLDLTSFAADPAEARAAYSAALARRFAGDDAGYRSALAAIVLHFPGTRAARRAAEVQRGAPLLGAGVALLATLSVAGNVKPKKKK
jgi:hypothetical protein